MGKILDLFKRREEERPDIQKDEPPKPGIVRFWQLYFRNFTKMLIYSAVFFYIGLSFACLIILLVGMVNPEMLTGYFGELAGLEGIDEAIPSSWVYLLGTIVFYPPWYVVYPLIAIGLILNGPMSCGLAYCLRNHTREEHVWKSDLFVRAWRNKWIGLFVGLLDALIVSGVTMYAFGTDTLGMSEGIFIYLKFISYAVGIIWVIMRIYICQMTVTFNLKLRGLLKNAWMFLILGFGRNLLMLICVALLSGIVILCPLYYPRTMPFFIIFMIFLFFGIEKFITVFTTYPVVHKYLVGPALEEQKLSESVARVAELKARLENGEEIDKDELEELEKYIKKAKKKK